MRKVLIISSSYTGHGHKSICTALSEQFSKYDDIQIQVIEGFKLIGSAAVKASSFYGPMTRYSPDLWHFTFSMSEITHEATNENMARLIHDRLMKKILLYHPDMIITLHSLFNGSVLNILEEYKLNIPFVTMIADMVDLHTTWCDPRATLVLCPTDESIEVCVQKGVPRAKTYRCGFPSRAQFTEAARNFSRPDYVSGTRMKFLLMSGGEGSGNLRKYAQELLMNFDCEVSIICGRNHKLENMLRESLLKFGSRAKVYGFVTDVEKHMLDADVVIARGSPNSIMEAVVCNVPLIITGALPGQEEHNPQLMVNHNLGMICESPKQLVSVVDDMFADDAEKWKHIRNGQRTYRNLDAAKEIVDKLDSMLSIQAYIVPTFKRKLRAFDHTRATLRVTKTKLRRWKRIIDDDFKL